MAPQASTPAGSYRFIPIEATTSNASTSANRRRNAKPTAPAVDGLRSFSLYQSQTPAPSAPAAPPAPSPHYNPQSAHPYFFPAVLAHEPGARLPSSTPQPTPQAPNPPNSTPNPAFSPPSNNTNAPNAAPPTNLHPSTSAQSLNAVTTACTAPAASPTPSSTAPPPKGRNPADRSPTHPNPLALGLTRISPPPECHYPNAEIAATVIHAWSTSRNFKLSRQKSDKNAAGEMYKQYYLCSRHGQPTNTHKVTAETRQRRQRKSERIGCPMGLVVRAIDATNPSGDWTVRWQLEGKSEWHNHGPATEEELNVEKARAERNERRKAAKGTGNGKRGRRLKDPNKPARKRDRRRKKPEDGQITRTAEVVDGVGADMGDAGGGVNIGNDEQQHLQQQQQDHVAQQQLQQELSRTLHEHDLMNGHHQHHQHQNTNHHHQQQQHQHHSHPLPHQHQHQQNPTTRPLPALWGLSNNNTMLPTNLDAHARARLEDQQQQAFPTFGRDGGMVYAAPPGNQAGLGYR